MYIILSNFTYFEPILYEAIGNGGWVGQAGEVVSFVPAAVGEFGFLQLQFAREVICREAYHQSAGIGPRLRTKVTDVGDVQVCLLPDFTTDAVFERFACLHKACHKTIVTVAKGMGMHHQYLVSSCHADNDGCCKAGPKFFATLTALLADFRLPLHLATANAAELRVLMKVNQLGTLACKLIVFGRKDVERFAKRHHLKVGMVGNGGR